MILKKEANIKNSPKHNKEKSTLAKSPKRKPKNPSKQIIGSIINVQSINGSVNNISHGHKKTVSYHKERIITS